MFQSIAARSIIPVGFVVTSFVGISCLCLYSIMKQDTVDDAAQHGRDLANTVVLSTRYAMLNNDRQHLGNIIANIGQHQGVEHLRIFNHQGVITFSRNQSEIGHQVNNQVEGCSSCHRGARPVEKLAAAKQTRSFINERGVEVLAVSRPIYNEPACSTSCHYHPASKKVLGMLDIGFDQGPLQKSLALMRYRMVIFTLMTLVLTVGGTAALLNRSFFLPLKKLIAATSSHDETDAIQQLESGYGELSLLARNYHSLLIRLKDTREALARCRSCSKGNDEGGES